MRAALVHLALLAACDAAPGFDGGTDSGVLLGTVRIEGPAHPFAGEAACFRALFDGTADRVRWTFGGGVEAEGIEACHTWPFVGARVIGVEVEARGRRVSATHTVHVVPRPSDPRPTGSSPILAHGSEVWVVSPDSGTVAVLATDPPALLAEIAVGARPRTLAMLDGVIAVACQDEGALILLDAARRERVRAVELGRGTEPYGVLADPRGGRFVVALRGSGEVATIDAASHEVQRLAVGPEPRGLAMTADGVLLATRWRATQDGASVYTIDVSDTGALALRGVTRLVRDEGHDSDTDNDGVPSFLNQIVLSPDGRRAIVPALKANVVAGLARTGAPLTSQTTARAILAEVVLEGSGPALESFRHSFDDLDFASAAVFSPLGDRLYVSMQGAQTVVIVDAFDFFTIGSIDSVGEAAQGLALSEDGRRLFVHAYLSRTVRVYDVSEASREPPLLSEVRTTLAEPLAPEVLEGARIFHRSRDPRMSRTRYLSCASCHLDAEGDALVWDFTQRGEGLRNTIELRGRAGVGHGPLHWSANFDEVQDFEHDIRAGQGGTGFMPDALFHADMRDAPLGAPKAGLSPELDALAAYLASLDSFGASSRRRDGDATWEAARARGEALFLDTGVGCATCHAGARFTDSALVGGSPILHDIGTLGPGSGQRLGAPLAGLDTPTLLGLSRSAPYLHDGSAETLRDVLDRNAEDRHGRTSHLTGDELDALVVYLESLE